jgi:hypothetical protein
MAGSARAQVPPDPVADASYPEHTVVLIPLASEAQYATIKGLGKSTFEPVTFYELRSDAGHRVWAFTGRPDIYIVWIDTFDPDLGTTSNVRKIRILPSGPDPRPEPIPPRPTPPDPAPEGELAALVFKAFKALPDLDKGKLAAVADNYEAVAAQAAVTPSNWNRDAMVAAVKQRNLEILGPATIEAWRSILFVPLAEYQSAQNLNASNVPGHVDLWRKTAAAFREALNAL